MKPITYLNNSKKAHESSPKKVLFTRCEEELYAKIVLMAEKNGMTLNTFVTTALEYFTEELSKEGKKRERKS